MSSEAPILRIATVDQPSQLSIVRQLFQEYSDEIEIDLCFQNFAQELAELPGKYAPPAGRLYLAMAGDAPAGCVALRPLAPEVAELKRLYVRPAFRRHGTGRLLTETALQAAGEIGYRAMRLDTLATMKPAIALYESLGFRHTSPYCNNPSPHAVFMEIALPSVAAASRQPSAQHRVS